MVTAKPSPSEHVETMTMVIDAGHVRIFEYSNNAWTQVGNDIDGEAAGDLLLGLSISGDGTIVATIGGWTVTVKILGTCGV